MPNVDFQDSNTDFSIFSVRVMRILRIFKLVRHFAGLQSLFMTLRQASVFEAFKYNLQSWSIIFDLGVPD